MAKKTRNVQLEGQQMLKEPINGPVEAAPAATKKETEHVSLLHKAMDQGVAPFTTKSSVVMAGWTFLHAITVSQTLLVKRSDEKSWKTHTAALFLDLFVFLLMTVAGAAISMKLPTLSGHADRVTRIYSAALALFPAWKWRDVDLKLSFLVHYFFTWTHVSSVIALLTLFAVSFALQIWVGNISKNLDPLSFTAHVATMVKCSLGLGLAVSIDSEMAKHVTFPPNELLRWIMLAIVSSIFLMLLQKLADQNKDSDHWYFKKLLPLVVGSATFGVGLAWNHNLDIIAKPWMNGGPHLQLGVSITFTILIGILVGFMSLTHDNKEVHDLVTNLAGFNVGLTWCDFALSLYTYMAELTESGDSVLRELTVLWAYSLVAMVLVAAWAFIMERLLKSCDEFADDLADQCEDALGDLQKDLEDGTGSSDSSSTDSEEHHQKGLCS